MSRKDYVRIAAVLAVVRHKSQWGGAAHQEAIDMVMIGLGALFYQDNPAFDYVRFEKACSGVTK